MMDYDTYRKKYFADPAPEQHFGFSGLHKIFLLYFIVFGYGYYSLVS